MHTGRLSCEHGPPSVRPHHHNRKKSQSSRNPSWKSFGSAGFSFPEIDLAKNFEVRKAGKCVSRFWGKRNRWGLKYGGMYKYKYRGIVRGSEGGKESLGPLSTVSLKVQPVRGRADFPGKLPLVIYRRSHSFISQALIRRKI